MAQIDQIIVLDQHAIRGNLGSQGCGIHVFKNTLLSLLFKKGAINQEQFDKLSKSAALVHTIYDAVKEIIAKRNASDEIERDHLQNINFLDVTVPKFFEMIEMAKAGTLDMSSYGITPYMINSLNLTVDGTQDLTPINVADYAEYGLCGSLEDLFAASTFVTLARKKDAYIHAFAVGYNLHWMAVVLHQDTNGNKRWQFMDSSSNQSIYKSSIVTRINAILEKDEPALQAYLIEAYDNSTDLIRRRFEVYFDKNTYQPIPGIRIDLNPGKTAPLIKDIKQFYVDHEPNRLEYIDNISHRMIFMENAGWLTSKVGKEEFTRIRTLHAIIKFMLEQGAETHLEIKEKLAPFVRRLEEVIALNTLKKVAIVNCDNDPQKQEETKVVPKPSASKVPESDEKEGTSQTVVAMTNVVKNGKPVATPILFNRLVTSITNFLRGITDAITHFLDNIATQMGIK